MLLGTRNRIVAMTNMNACSSRSHSIFTMTIRSRLNGDDLVRTSTVRHVAAKNYAAKLAQLASSQTSSISRQPIRLKDWPTAFMLPVLCAPGIC